MADSFQPRFVDLVRNTTKTSGTGNLVLGAPVPGYVGFAQALSPGDQFYYSIVGVEKPNETEVGRGTMMLDGTIAREPISDVRTNFSAGTKTISLVTAAEWYRDIQLLRAAKNVEDRAALAKASTGILVTFLSEARREGTFVFDPSDKSAEVAVDTMQGIYVAPSSDPTGESGAWVRHFDGAAHVGWFGALGDGVTDDSTSIQAGLELLKTLGGGTLIFQDGMNYVIGTGLRINLTADGSAPIRLQSGGCTILQTIAPIDILTISNTASSGNTRRVIIDGLGFCANNPGARSLVLSNASYNQFINLDFLGSGQAIVCGSAVDDRNIGNQFTNTRLTGVGTGVLISGRYNIFTNLQILEGLQGGPYAIQIDGTGCIVDGFVARGAGGSGGLATIVLTGTAAGSVIANGYVFDSYAIGVAVGGARYNKVTNVTIVNSQTHGLQLSGCLQGRFDVVIQHSSLASTGAYHHIHCVNTPTDNALNAQFVGTAALLDINEPSGANNVWICGSLPNGKTIGGANSVAISAGNARATSFSVGTNQVIGARKTGWALDTGTPKRTANATYSGAAEAEYTQATIQALMDAVRDVSQTVKALKDDLHASAGHGLIGT